MNEENNLPNIVTPQPQGIRPILKILLVVLFLAILSFGLIYYFKATTPSPTPKTSPKASLPATPTKTDNMIFEGTIKKISENSFFVSTNNAGQEQLIEIPLDKHTLLEAWVYENSGKTKMWLIKSPADKSDLLVGKKVTVTKRQNGKNDAVYKVTVETN